MNKLILTGLLAAGTMTHIQGVQPNGQQSAGQENLQGSQQGNQQKSRQENQQKNGSDKDQRPNILFILSDDHTSQAWGIYGGILADYAHNENIRRLANEGVVLDNCFCTNSISAPSRASILTGLYSHRNGLYTLADSLDTSIPTLATALQANGYNTGLVGKWHIQSQPQGFDYYSIFYDQGEYRDPTFIESTDPWPGNRRFGERVLGFSTDLVTEKAINWIKQQDSNEPFLMCCHFKATHEPYDYPTRMEHLYDGVTFPEPENLLDWGPETNGRSFVGQTIEELERRWRTASKDPDKWWCRYPGLPFSTEGMQRTAARRAAYQKFIRDYMRCGATVDDNIGKLLKTLDEMGIADNTIVVYVSDQGYFLGEHGFFDKRMFYEESARMPFVIRYPKKDSRRETPEGLGTQRRLCADTGRVCRSKDGECTRTQLHRQPRRKNSDRLAERNLLPLLDEPCCPPGTFRHPFRPVQTYILLRQEFGYDRYGKFRFHSGMGFL